MTAANKMLNSTSGMIRLSTVVLCKCFSIDFLITAVMQRIFTSQ